MSAGTAAIVLAVPPRLQPRSRREAQRQPAASAGREGLELEGVGKTWVDQRRTALHDVDLAIDRGMTAAVIGDNGSGKTTLLRVIAGLLKPNHGSIRLNGLDSERDGRRYRARIGFLSAGNAGLVARLSVRRQLEYSSRVALLGRREARDAVAHGLRAFGLEELASRRVDRVSLGQRQRVRAALAFLHRPDLVLLDEPDNSLDEPGALLLRGAVREVTTRGGMVLWCAPAFPEDGDGIDRRFVMRAGHLSPE